MRKPNIAVYFAVLAAALPARAGAPDLPAQARAERRRLEAVCPRFRVVPLPRAGELALDGRQSLTVEDLRGVPLDTHPPVLGTPPAYDPRQTDTFAPGQAPYEAPGIRAFRFRYFNCEFNYGGWHNLST
ncbi:MAG: hypothetical protein JXR37_26955 [Kiritimatiellae bacterium]|nr:hypothetical protein [Kiritimatiellia bacterium]